MYTKIDATDYEGKLYDARQLRTGEFARVYGNIVEFFRARQQAKVEKKFRPVTIGKHGVSMWPCL